MYARVQKHIPAEAAVQPMIILNTLTPIPAPMPKVGVMPTTIRVLIFLEIIVSIVKLNKLSYLYNKSYHITVVRLFCFK